ncbi:MULTISPECIES: UbiD family decarboxylase [Streptomyces]|uniref:Pyrrole-2-carboxylic acid decarboxylase n=2 Tax=Streptomyces TaxID=1883 RepID=A0ABV9IW10_9ACTN
MTVHRGGAGAPSELEGVVVSGQLPAKKRLKSFRAYLDALAELGDLQKVAREVDTHLEIGAIIRRCHEVNAPAPLFTNIRDHAGYRVVGAPLSYSSDPEARMARVALALGLDRTTHGLRIIEALAEATHALPVPPVTVRDAPCQEHVLIGDKADLTKFPVPLIHDGDGGRYFNTLGMVVLRSPDGTWSNWSITRAMMIDGARMTGSMGGSQHIGMIRQMWRDRGEPMPFALVQGAEPAALFVAGMALPEGVDEAGYLGGYFGEPVETVPCRTVDLEVPATAEIVVEGYVASEEVWEEGPMGEYHGYLHGGAKDKPVYHVSAITHRHRPILPVVAAGKPVDEDHTIMGPGFAAVVLEALRADGIPARAAWFVPESAAHVLAVVVAPDWARRIPLSAADLGHRILAICKATHGGWLATRVMLVDQDIDPTDLRDLMWAWATRCHPVNDRTVVGGQPIARSDVLYTRAERGNARGPVELLNCLLPTTRNAPRSTAFAENFSPDLQWHIRSHWAQ